MEPNEAEQPEFSDNDEFIAPAEDAAVAVAPAPAVNGTHPANLDATRKISVSYNGPGAARAAASDLMGRINNRPATAREPERNKDDREWLNAFMVKPEAEDCQLCLTRYQPACNADGDPIPNGIDSKHLMPVTYYDDLHPLIAEVWGGGAYRLTICDQNGRKRDDINKSILINISTVQYPPKRAKYEKIESRYAAGKATPAAIDLPDDEVAKKRRERELLLEEERLAETRDRSESAKSERDYKRKKRDLELAQLERDLNPRRDEKSAELALMEKRLEEEKRLREESVRKAEEDRKERDRKYEDDRKEAQRRYEEDKKETQRRADDDRKLFMDGLTKLAEKLSEVANKPPPPKEDGMEKILAVMSPIVAAIINKPAPQLPDNKEIFIAMGQQQAEATKQLASMTTAMLAQPKADPMAAYMPMMMEVVKGNKTAENNLIGNLITSLTQNKSELTPDVMMQLIGMGEKRADKIIEMTQNYQHGENEDGYDPALGMLGNAGKAIFNGLKSLLESAATNPAVQELMMKFVGSRNPNEQQLAQAAWQMEHGGRAVPIQPQLQYQPTDQQFVQPQPNPYAQPQQPQPQRRGPAPLPGARPAQGQPPVNQAQQQTAVANELEGTASGLPGNGDPEQGPPPTPEELAIQELRNAVTATIEIAIGEAKNKPNKRLWPEDATDHWPLSFIQQIVANPSRDERGKLIGRACWEDTIQQFMQILNVDREEVTRFQMELDRFVDLNVGKVVLPGHAQPQQPVAPPPPVQQPVSVIVPDPPVNR